MYISESNFGNMEKEDKFNETTVSTYAKKYTRYQYLFFRNKGIFHVPNSEQLINLSLAGLGKERVVFQIKMEIIILFKKLWRKSLEVKKAGRCS